MALVPTSISVLGLIHKENLGGFRAEMKFYHRFPAPSWSKRGSAWKLGSELGIAPELLT
jgi:hypothetical protein